MTALLALALLAQQPQAAPDTAVLLALGRDLIEKEYFLLGEAVEGDVVVFNPKYRNEKRCDFAELKKRVVDNLNRNLKHFSERAAEAGAGEAGEKLRRSESSTYQTLEVLRRFDSASMADLPVEPLKEKWLGPRILVQSLPEKGRYTMNFKAGEKEVRLKVYLTLDPPGYSRSGNQAAVTGSFPSGIHAGTIWALLQKEAGAWKVVQMISRTLP